MMKRIKPAAKILLGRSNRGRNVTVHPDDIFLVSYPKSGNTWSRFLIGSLMYQNDETTFANVERRVPDIYQNTEEELARVPRPRILKSHEYFDPRYKRVIYIVRDPRDVVISYYHHHIKLRTIEEGYPIAKYVQRFVAGELDLLGSWGENVGSWLGARRGSNDFLLLRYEDMLKQASQELDRVATFLSINATTIQFSNAIEASSPDHMRELEKMQSHLWKTTEKSRQDKPFIRSAKAGGWRSELPQSSTVLIEEVWGPLMHELGYTLSER